MGLGASRTVTVRPTFDSSVVEYVEVLHHGRQLDRIRLRQLAHRSAVRALKVG
jgi:hypothetical protein